MTEKDAVTEKARRLILASHMASETSRAEPGLTTLSFRSLIHPERGVWIDTDLGGEMVVDIEVTTNTASWDNSITSYSAKDFNHLTNIAVSWLSGSSLDDVAKIASGL